MRLISKNYNPLRIMGWLLPQNTYYLAQDYLLFLLEKKEDEFYRFRS